MTIKQHGGIFGRNPTFNDLTGGSGSSIEGSGSSVTFSVDRTDASTDGALVLRAAASSLSIDSDGANKDILIRTGGSTERARFYGDNGNFSIKGNLIVQTSGSGIDFSATSGTGTSQLLDDYEEGTWTPTVGGSDVGSGAYIKVGTVIYFHCLITANSLSTTTIDGLPFTMTSASGYGPATWGRTVRTDALDANGVPCRIRISGTQLGFYTNNSSGNDSTFTVTTEASSTVRAGISGVSKIT